MKHPIEILNKIKQTSLTNEKIDLISDEINFSNSIFIKILHYALDPYKVFGIKQLPKLKENNLNNNDFDMMFKLLDEYASNKITGNKAIEAADKFMSYSSVDTQEIFKRIIGKDLKCGVGTKLVNNAFEQTSIPEQEWIPSFDLMAAHLYDIKKAEYPCYAEPKLDGMRCAYFIDEIYDHELDKNVKTAFCYSRGGKEIETLDAITTEMLDLYPVGYLIDGEIITPGSFEGAMSIIRRKKENQKEGDIFFNVFDVLTIEEFETQTSPLTLKQRREQRFHKVDTKFVKTVEQTIVNNEEEAFSYYEKCIEKGFPYEGVMLKKINMPYDYKRSNSWLKIKPEETLDLTVIGYYEGEPETKNEGRLGGFIVDYKGKEIRVGGGYKEKEPTEDEPNLINERRIFWEQKNELVGDIMEVKYMEITSAGSLRHPRFIRWRSFKGEKI